MADLNDPAQLSQVLSMLSANDSATIKQGEKFLKTFLKQPASVPAVLNQMASPDVSVRHHAALLLKKKVGIHYKKFDAAQQSALRAQLLAIITNEPDRGVATSLAGAIAVLTKVLFASGQQWPEIFQLLMTLSQDPIETRRVLAFNLLEQLAEHVATELKAHVETLASMFVAGCQDANQAVAISALQAVAQFITQLGNAPEIMSLQCVINPMFAVMAKCVASGEDETVIVGLEVIQECTQLEQPIINDHLDVIVQFILGIIAKKEHDASLRNASAQTLMNIIEARPKLLAKKALVGPMLTILMEMIAKEDASAAGMLFAFSNPNGILDEEKDDDYDDDEENTQRLAQQIIDTMAIHVPSKYFSEPALQLCGQGMGSADPQMRKAGCAVLGVIAEGCCDKIKEQLSLILPILLSAVADPEYYVRECACFALGQFSEYCQPDILHHNAKVLPVIFTALDDERPTVQSTSCYVLEYFCEHLQPETLRPYLQPLMGKLANLLQAPSNTTKEMALTAIAATAVAAEIEFLPFTEHICQILHVLIFNTEPKMFATRGRALECLGHIGVAVGCEHFERYFQSGMQSAEQALSLNDDNLKEHSYVFVANCAKVMGVKFTSYLPSLVPILIDVVNEPEIFIPDEDEDEDDEEPAAAAGGGDDDEEDDDMGDYRVNVEEGFINSKKAALTALGALAEHTKEAYAPYLKLTYDSIMQEEVGAAYSLHDVIKSEALLVLQFLVQVGCASAGIVEKPKFGEVVLLPDAIKELAQSVFTIYVETILTDSEKPCVAAACEGVIALLQALGLSALHLAHQKDPSVSLATKLMEALQALLMEKSPCQVASKVEHDDGEDDDDHDNDVMDSVTDVIGQLAKVLGANFVRYFDEFHKPLMKFTKESRPYSDRSMAIGCYAEVFAEIGPEAMRYTQQVLPVVKKGLDMTEGTSMESVRRNSAFCIGVLVESTGMQLAQFFPEMLQWLAPLCVRTADQSTTDAGGADIDNALSAVSKMIKVAPQQLPVGQILPVLLAALPLRDDTTEGPCVYGMLASLISAGHPDAVSLLLQIVAAYFEVLSSGSTAMDDTKTVVRAALKALAASPYAQVLNDAFAQVQDLELQEAIKQAIVA